MRPPRRSISAAGIVVVMAVIAALAVVIWVLLLVRHEESPLQPSPEAITSPVSTPTVSSPAAVVATPEPTISVVPTVIPGSMPDLVRYAPDRLANNSLPLSDIASYADLEGWMKARGITIPTGPDDPAWDPWEQELDVMALPDILHARANEPVWRETYGFQLADVDQVLAVGQSPDYIIIMQGDFKADALQSAWVKSGYQAIREQNYTIWSLFPGDAVDLSAPASRPALGNLNNLVLLDDGTLIATSRLSRMQETLRVVRGEVRSLGDNPEISALLAPGAGAEGLSTATIAKGSLLATDPSTPVVLSTPPVIPGPGTPGSTPVAEQPMPAINLMLAGLSPPESRGEAPVLSIIVSYENVDDAIRAMIRIDHQLHQDRSPITGHPYTNRIHPLDMRVVDTRVDAVDLLIKARPLHGSADWLTMIQDRDLGFLMWPWRP